MFASLLLATTNSVEYSSTDGGGLFAGVLIVTLGLVLLGLVSTIFWVWMLVDAIKAPKHAWDQIGQQQILWIALAIFPLGVIASLLHFFWLRPQLKAVVAY